MTETPIVLHNPGCSTSRNLLARAAEGGAEVEVVNYVTNPLTADQLQKVIEALDDPAAAVRHDNRFKDLGLNAADYTTAAQVIALLREHPLLMQRPIVWRGERAVIARPLDNADALLGLA